MAVILFLLAVQAHEPTMPPEPSYDTACVGTTRNANGTTIRVDHLDSTGHVIRRMTPTDHGWSTEFTRHFVRIHPAGDQTIVFWTEDQGADGTVDTSEVVELKGARVIQQRRTGGGIYPHGGRVLTFVYEGDAHWPLRRYRHRIVYSVDAIVDPMSMESWSARRDDAFVRSTPGPAGEVIKEDWRLENGRVVQAGPVTYRWSKDEIATRTEGDAVTSYVRATPTARCRMAEAVMPWSRYGPDVQIP